MNARCTNTTTPVSLNYTGTAISPSVVQVVATSGSVTASAPFATDFHIYVGANDIGGNAFILSIDAASPATQSATANMASDQVTQIAVNSAGTLGFFGTQISAQVRGFTIAGGVPTLGGSKGLANPIYISASADGTQFFAGNGNNLYQIAGTAASPGLIFVVAQSGQQYVASDGINIYTAPNVEPNTVYGFPIAGGMSVSDNFGGGAATATNVAIGGTTLFVGDTGAAKSLSAFPLPLVGCPPCGQQTAISVTNFIGPVTNPQGTRVYVLDSSNGKLLRYGVGTGASLTPLSSVSGLAASQTIMTIDPAGGYVYLTQTSGAVVTIYQVNTQTGAVSSFNASVGGPYSLRALTTGL